jgi:uncharacterized membrane protein
MRLNNAFLKPFLGALALLICITAFYPPLIQAEESQKALPSRAFVVAPEYSSVDVPEGKDVNIDIIVQNKGRQGEIVNLVVNPVPKGWKAWFKAYTFKIGGLYVESDSIKKVTLHAEPEKDTGPGQYVFPVKAETKDGKLSSSSELLVVVEKKEAEVKKEASIGITTSYPVLTGPTDTDFEFSLNVENNTGEEAIFNLASEAPKNWEINFKPSYQDKHISSLRIKDGASEGMGVEVKPFLLAEPGEYTIKVRVGSDKAKEEVALRVVLKGTYKLEAGTPNGLLSLNAYQGKPANLSLYVENKGSAPQNDIKFVTFKPENWKLEFSPEKIETLAPGEMKQVEMTITPADQALVGDYSLGVNITGEKSTKDLEFRVTVRTSSAWGWIGIIIIIAVVAGLVFLFVRVGRR